jgi:hypothetical protein
MKETILFLSLNRMIVGFILTLLYLVGHYRPNKSFKKEDEKNFYAFSLITIVITEIIEIHLILTILKELLIFATNCMNKVLKRLIEIIRK